MEDQAGDFFEQQAEKLELVLLKLRCYCNMTQSGNHLGAIKCHRPIVWKQSPLRNVETSETYV